MAQFAAAQSKLPSATERQVESIRTYYQTQFGREYSSRNAREAAPIDSMLAGHSSKTQYLQYQYIAGNRHPLGSKHLLDYAADQTDYQRVHQQYHSTIRQYLESFGFYDIFLVDSATGMIVYSVFKELDYMTSLKSGPYAASGIGKAFAAANKMSDPNGSHLTDFSPYTPSYEDSASFIASPIFKDGQKIGVLIFQMPIDNINSVMTSGEQWQETGLGASGEIYLVGQDQTLRSESRFLIEDPDGYFDALKKANIDDGILETIRSKKAGLGRQPVDTDASRRALSGESGFDIILDYREVSVLSAYAPLEIMGLKWGIMAEIDEAEALESVGTLKQSIAGTVVMISVLFAVIAFGLAYVFDGKLLKPLRSANEGMHNIALGDGDLTKRIPLEGNDEFTELAENFNQFAQKIQNTVQIISRNTDVLGNNLDATTSLANTSLIKLEEQQSRSAQTNHSVSEVATSIIEVAQKTEEVSSSSAAASQDTIKANELFSRTQMSMNHLCDKIEGSIGHREPTQQERADRAGGRCDQRHS